MTTKQVNEYLEEIFSFDDWMERFSYFTTKDRPNGSIGKTALRNAYPNKMAALIKKRDPIYYQQLINDLNLKFS